MNHKVLIFSAPSGTGKSTIVSYLLKRFPQLEFSISATSRAPRGEEINGKEYYFLSKDEFMQKVKENAFFEWEEVYSGSYYGTLQSEMERIWKKGNTVVFDIDVNGGLNIKRKLGSRACSIFIMPPSIEELRRRLTLRNTDTPEAIEKRIAKAEQEIACHDKFDIVIVNDDLETACKQAEQVVRNFISRAE